MSKVLIYLFIAMLLVAVAVHFSVQHIKSSAEWEAAEKYIRQNKDVSGRIGEIKTFGYFVSEDEEEENGMQRCVIQMKAIGQSGELHIMAYLVKSDTTQWQVKKILFK